MGGTRSGGLKAEKTNRRIHGEDFYQRIGKKGGRAYHEARGFAAMPPEKVSEAGAKGGRVSRREGGSKRRVLDEHREHIIKSYADGTSVRELAKKYGVSGSTVYKWLDDQPEMGGPSGRKDKWY